MGYQSSHQGHVRNGRRHWDAKCSHRQAVPEMKEWQQRPLESIYPVVWLDAIHFKVKDNGRFVSKAVIRF